jgi:hypothetical protein
VGKGILVKIIDEEIGGRMKIKVSTCKVQRGQDPLIFSSLIRTMPGRVSVHICPLSVHQWHSFIPASLEEGGGGGGVVGQKNKTPNKKKMIKF